jgi:hypothetical protein
MFLTSVNRIGAVIYVLLAAMIVGAVIRRAMRLSGHFDACADALTLTGGTIDDRFLELARTLSPSTTRSVRQSEPASMMSPK